MAEINDIIVQKCGQGCSEAPVTTRKVGNHLSCWILFAAGAQSSATEVTPSNQTENSLNSEVA
jgi:hypothetical protein